jgi:carboxypeptidase Taq
MTGEPPATAASSRRYEELLRRWGEISDLGRARALLAWDERTMMPASGADGRAEQIATLARVRHERITDDRLWELIEELGVELGGADAPGIEAATVRAARRDCEKARRVPAELRAEMAGAASRGEAAWAAARPDSDLETFLPHLTRNVELRRRYAECFAPSDHPYDPLLDDFEPGLPTAAARRILAELRAGLVPIVAAVAESGVTIGASPLERGFPVAAQRRVVAKLVGSLPLPPGTWRLDPTLHPFATSIAAGDLRLTTHYDPDDLSFAVFSAMHEAGHGIYEAGVPAELRRGPIGHPTSLAFHESQSRLWENWVGRSRPFLAGMLPLLRSELGGELDDLDPEQLYRSANRAHPSLIRVEADELAYNLHIALRFELELELFEGGLEAGDLAEAWTERSRDYLGLEVPDHARGVMQDVHWAAGSFGYFPTYSLGNIIAAQLWELAEAELGGLEALIEAGELGLLRDWLGERIHRHGARYLPAELAERALGGPIDPAALLRRLRVKYGELYSF